MLAWDRVVRGEHGGAREGAGRKPLETPKTINVDNIHVERMDRTVRPDGTSAQAGLRRLEKAASAGDPTAADLLRRVVNPNDDMSDHLLNELQP